MTWAPEPCHKCGHPADYHGMTFCKVEAGASHKRDCDCTGWLASKEPEQEYEK